MVLNLRPWSACQKVLPPLKNVTCVDEGVIMYEQGDEKRSGQVGEPVSKVVVISGSESTF